MQRNAKIVTLKVTFLLQRMPHFNVILTVVLLFNTPVYQYVLLAPASIDVLRNRY